MAHLQKKLKIALINPPFLPRYSRTQRSPGVIKSGTMYYPYWLAHATAVLMERGFECVLYDCPAANIDANGLFDALQRNPADLLIIETSTASSENDYALASKLKERFGESRICMVGTHATATWEDTLSKYRNIDYVAIGEYDYTVADLAEALESRGNASREDDVDRVRNIAALGFRFRAERLSRGPMRAPIENVDELPWIAPIYKKFLDSKNYYFSLASYPMVMLIGGRGCVAKCTYCVYPQVMHGHRYRTRSPESIVGEMKWIQENLPEVKEVVFEDDTFTGDRAFAKRVAELVNEKGVRLPWFANVRTNVDRETLSYMKEAGFRCCAVGFESGDDVLLKNMWKGQTVAMQKTFVENCKDLDILVHGCFMFGFPGETRATMKSTLDLSLYLSPDSAQFYPVMPFPGTSYYAWAKENKYLATEKFSEWVNDEGGHRCVLNLPGLKAEEIEKFCEKAYLRFYFRPKYMWYKLKQAFGSAYEGVRSVKSFLFFVWYLVTNKRKKTTSFNIEPIPVPTDWYSVQKMPKGRMFEQATLINQARNAGPLTDDELKRLAVKNPAL